MRLRVRWRNMPPIFVVNSRHQFVSVCLFHWTFGFQRNDRISIGDDHSRNDQIRESRYLTTPASNGPNRRFTILCEASKTDSVFFLCLLPVCPLLCNAPDKRRGDIFGPPNGQHRRCNGGLKNRSPPKGTASENELMIRSIENEHQWERGNRRPESRLRGPFVKLLLRALC